MELHGIYNSKTNKWWAGSRRQKGKKEPRTICMYKSESAAYHALNSSRMKDDLDWDVVKVNCSVELS
jgi:hypothetical protein